MDDKNSFSVGQICCFGGYGLGKITDRASKTTEGQTEEYWKVELAHKQIAWIPMSRAHESLRPILAAEKALEIFNILIQPDVPYDSREFSVRAKDYFLSKTETGLDPKPMARHLRALYSSPVELSFGEKKAVFDFEEALVEELALALDRPLAEVLQQLRNLYPTAYLGLWVSN